MVILSAHLIQSVAKKGCYSIHFFVFQPESCPEADSSMSQDRRSGSFGYRRRSKSMERKDSVRRRSLDNEANDESSLTVEKGRIFRPSGMLPIF